MNVGKIMSELTIRAKSLFYLSIKQANLTNKKAAFYLARYNRHIVSQTTENTNQERRGLSETSELTIYITRPLSDLMSVNYDRERQSIQKNTEEIAPTTAKQFLKIPLPNPQKG